MSQFWENLRTDGRTDGRMDWPYFIGPFQLWPGVQKEDIFCTVYFVRGNFFKIRVLPQCIVYLIRLRNINTFTYQKTFLHILLLLVFKKKAFIVSLSSFQTFQVTYVITEKYYKLHSNTIIIMTFSKHWRSRMSVSLGQSWLQNFVSIFFKLLFKYFISHLS